MEGLRVTLIDKEVKFQEVWDELKSKTGFHRQSVTKYLRLILAFTSLQEKIISYFSRAFC